MAEEDRVLSKTKKWLKWGGVISTGIVTILTPLIIMYVEVKPQVDQASANAEGGYEAIVPAIVEMQGILNDAKEWAEETDEEIRTLLANHKMINERLIRCEAYIELLGNQRNLPDAPAAITEAQPTSDLPPPKRADSRPIQQTAQYELPKSIGGAKAKVDARKKAGCEPGDPLCGGL